MISYRKLAMRVLGHSPVSAVKTARRSTAKRTAALALTAALQGWRKNALLSILAGTGLYVLLRNGF